MKTGMKMTGWVLAVLFAILWLAAPQGLEAKADGSDVAATRTVKRVGMVVGLNEAVIDEYKRLHADDYAGVRDLLGKYNMHNFSIFLHQIEGKWYEFGYYEYTGDDFDGDMAKLDAEPRNKEWLVVCDPMQVPLKGEKGWAEMEMVYHND
jgi:L-rhamnose mutarotase